MTTNPYTVEPPKSNGTAYILWLFLAPFGGHRFYLNRKKTAWWQLGLTLTLVGYLVVFFWMIADLFLIPEMVREENVRLADEWESRNSGDTSSED